MRTLILDSSSIISMSLNNLLGILRLLKKKFDVKFVITPEVKKEVVDNPLEVRRFELEALMVMKLIEEKVIEISSQNIDEETKKIYDISNSIYSAEGENLRLIHSGESSCMALSSLIPDSVLVIDERTTRMLCESPENLRKLMKSKLHTNVSMDKKSIKIFSKFKVLRSTELAYIALKNKLLQFPVSEEKSLDAVLFALKYKGCSISYEEIEQVKKL